MLDQFSRWLVLGLVISLISTPSQVRASSELILGPREMPTQGSEKGIKSFYQGMEFLEHGSPHEKYTLATEHFRVSAIEGIWQGEYTLALINYQRRFHLSAAKSLARLLNSGHKNPKIIMLYAMMHLVGNGVEKDFDWGYSVMLKLAEKDVAFAQFFLAFLADSEMTNLPVGHKSSTYWLHRSAENGYHKAMTALAMRYEHGQMVPKIPDYAFELYNKAAKLSDPVAMNNLAHMYYEGGIAFPKDDDKTERLLKESARLGLKTASANLHIFLTNKSKSERVNGTNSSQISMSH